MNPNQLKSINGYNNNMSLLQLLQKLQEERIIAFCKSVYRNGYQEYDTSQFFAPFYIEFFNGEGWLIFASTSIRNDRMNNQQWNSFHIRKLAPNITKAYLTMPDEIVENQREYQSAKSYNKKIDDHKMYSSIDGVFTQSQLIDAIIRYSEHLSSSKTSSEDVVCEPSAPYGTSISGSKVQL